MDQATQLLVKFLTNFFDSFVKAFEYIAGGLTWFLEYVGFLPSFIGSVCLISISILIMRFVLLK